MELTQILALVSIVSTCGACFSTGVAVALWNTRDKVEQVPVVVQRINTIEKDVGRLADVYGQLAGWLARGQVGHTDFTKGG